MPTDRYYIQMRAGDLRAFEDLADATAYAAQELNEFWNAVLIHESDGRRWHLSLDQEGKRIIREL